MPSTETPSQGTKPGYDDVPMSRAALFPFVIAIASCAEGHLPSYSANDPRNPNAPEGKAVVTPSTADAPLEDAGATRGDVVYVCPMHSDVTRDRPGKCPRCGMTFIKREPK